MEFTIVSTLRELQRERTYVFREIEWRPLLILFGAVGIVIVTVVAVVFESTVERRNGVLHVSVGGPITCVGIIAFSIYAVWWAVLAWPIRREGQRLLREVHANQTIFCRITDEGIAFGLTDLWSKQFAWELVSAVEIKKANITVTAYGNTIDINSDQLEPSDEQELETFLSATRDVVAPEAVFGFSITRRDSKVFGPLRK